MRLLILFIVRQRVLSGFIFLEKVKYGAAQFAGNGIGFIEYYLRAVADAVGYTVPAS